MNFTPTELGASIIFAIAVLHTFCTGYFETLASKSPKHAGLWHLLGEVEIVFGFFGMIVVAYFSRWREFRADAGGAKLGGRGKMIAALQRLQASTQRSDFADDSGKMAAFKISGGKGGFLALFSTHPPLEERIARLKSAT